MNYFTKSMHSISLLLVLAAAAVGAAVVPQPARITVRGTILAVYVMPACGDHTEVGAAVVRFDSAGGHEPRYGVVNFELPCGEEPRWLKQPVEAEELKLVRSTKKKIILPKTMSMLSSDGSDVHEKSVGWTCRTAADCSGLPYGKAVPLYRFADMAYKFPDSPEKPGLE